MSNWRRLDDIITYYGKGVTPKYVDESSIIVLNQKCIRHNKIDYSFAQYIDDNKKYNEDKYLRIGDILVNSTGQGTAGRVAMIDFIPPEKRLIVDSHILVLRTNSFYESKCLNYSLFSIESLLQTYIDGSTGQGEFDKIRLFNIQVGYSENESTQQKIAAVLSALDDKIEHNNRINAELEQMAKTLYDYWFMQFDFPDRNGKPYKYSGGKMVYNEVLKREIPEGWKTEKIERLGTIVGGSTPSKAIEENFTQDGIPWITPKDLSMNFGKKFITRGELDVSTKGLKEASLNILPTKSVLMSSRAPIGYVAINRVDCTTNQGFKSIICNKEYSCEYVFHVIKHYMPLIEANASGSTFREISSSVFKSINVIRPKKQVVEEFSKRVKPFFEKQDNLEQQNQELSTLRDWLLPLLMNGQARVDKLSNQISENDNTKEDDLSMAAEPQSAYVKAAPLNIPENKKGFAKQILAGKIVSEFKEDPNFTDIKFQKIQFLAEHIIEADLNLNYYYQVAGPYDNRFMHTIHNDFGKQKWFDCRNRQFIPLEKQEKIEEYYSGYFASAQEQLNKLFKLLYQTSEAEAEIIATLYAVWNNRIIEGRTVADEELIEDFYKWSDRKQQYTEEEVLNGLQWLRTHQMEPKGFGKLIKKAKGKK